MESALLQTPLAIIIFLGHRCTGSVLSGGLSGHVHGTAAYDITTTGEPAGMRPHFWDALKYESGLYMQHLNTLILSEGEHYQSLRIASQDIIPQKAQGSPEKGLDGWSYMMRTPEKDFALLYFENQSVLPEVIGFKLNTLYSFKRRMGKKNFHESR